MIQRPISNNKKKGIALIPIFRRLFLVDFFVKVGPSEKLSFIAVLVSAFSVYMGVLQFKETQRQFDLQLKNSITNQHLSVRPLISGYSNASVQNGKAGFYITNGGIGPALILNISAIYKGQKVNRIWDLATLFEEEGNERFYTDIEKVTFTDKVDTIITLLPNEKYFLFSTSPENVADHYLLRNCMDKLTVEVDYESLYKEKFNYTRKAKSSE